MTARDDAIFLAGFIVGTYDLRGDAAPPTYVKSVIDRVMTSDSPESAQPKIEDMRHGSHEIQLKPAHPMPAIETHTPTADLPVLITKTASQTVEETMTKARRAWSPEAKARSEERKALRKQAKKPDLSADQEKIEEFMAKKGATPVPARFAGGVFE